MVNTLSLHIDKMEDFEFDDRDIDYFMVEYLPKNPLIIQDDMFDNLNYIDNDENLSLTNSRKENESTDIEFIDNFSLISSDSRYEDSLDPRYQSISEVQVSEPQYEENRSTIDFQYEENRSTIDFQYEEIPKVSLESTIDFQYEEIPKVSLEYKTNEDVIIAYNIKKFDQTFSIKRLLVLELANESAKQNRYYKLCLELVDKPSLRFNYNQGGIYVDLTEGIMNELKLLPELVYNVSLNSILMNLRFWQAKLSREVDIRYEEIINMDPIKDIFYCLRFMKPLVDPFIPETLRVTRHISKNFVYSCSWPLSGIFFIDIAIANLMDKLNVKDTNTEQMKEDLNLLKILVPSFDINEIKRYQTATHKKKAWRLYRDRSDLINELLKLPLIYTKTSNGVHMTPLLHKSIEFLEVPDQKSGAVYTKRYKGSRDLVYEFFSNGGSFGKYTRANVEDINRDAIAIMNKVHHLFVGNINYYVISYTEAHISVHDDFFKTLVVTDHINDPRNLILYDPIYV
ncbi:hypothetical protein D3C87_1024730 [compost metagenome]